MQKQFRLTKRSDFNKVYRYGRSTANRQFVVYVMNDTQTEHYKVGISVSKKIGNAVVRNRMKRRLKEIVRLDSDHIKRHIQFVIIVRNPAVDLSYDQLRKSLIHVMKKARLWNKSMV